MTTLPVKTLGKSLEVLREHLNLAEAGERTEVDGNTEIWSFRESGLAANLVNGCVKAIFLYSDGYDDFAGFQGDTDGLRLDSSKQLIRYKFGYPTRHREGETSPVLGTVPNFDRYDYDDYSLHFQYDASGAKLRMLTIMSPDEVRRIEGVPDDGPDRPVVYDKAKYHFDSVQELELPEEQSAVHTAFFLGWLMDNDLCSTDFVDDSRAEVAAYKRREKTALEVYALWDYCLVDEMLSDEGNAFAKSYFEFSAGKYIGDFAELLARKLPSEFHVPYTWKNQKKIGHRISKRYSEWKEPGRSVSRQNESARSYQRPARRQTSPVKQSGKLWWIFKFILFPILAVAISLAIIIYASTL